MCSWGDDAYRMGENVAYAKQEKPDIFITATRTKGATVEILEQFAKDNEVTIEWIAKNCSLNESQQLHENLIMVLHLVKTINQSESSL